MKTFRIDTEPKKYNINDINKIRYYNLLIKNHVLEFHLMREDTKIQPRKIYSEELEYEYYNCFKYQNYSYVIGLEKNCQTGVEDIVIHYINNDDEYDIYDSKNLQLIKKEIDDFLEINVDLSIKNISFI